MDVQIHTLDKIRLNLILSNDTVAYEYRWQKIMISFNWRMFCTNEKFVLLFFHFGKKWFWKKFENENLKCTYDSSRYLE